MAAFAESTDLEERWRPLTPDETTRATVLLGDASAMIRGLAVGIDKRVADFIVVPMPAGALDPDVPKMIVCSMVKRAMIGNGEMEGVSSQQVQTGPFGNTVSYSNPMGNLYLSKVEKKQLGIGGQRAFTIDPTPAGAWPA